MFEVLQATVASFGLFLPNLVTVRHHDPDDTRRQADVRLGLLLASGWSFIVALHYAQKSGSSRPYLYWFAGVLTMAALYEASLRDRNDIDLR